MLHIQCLGCHTSAYVDCTCPPGHDPVAAGHLPAVSVGTTTVPPCPMADLGAAVVCPPGAGCCDGKAHPGLSHDQAAHQGHPNMAAGNGIRDHGGEHGMANADCAVCRPVTITVLPGSATVRPVTRVGA